MLAPISWTILSPAAAPARSIAFSIPSVTKVFVHVFSAPLGYLTRPYIVYRRRDDAQLGSHRPRRGWDRVG
jgi:hypothetical protein